MDRCMAAINIYPINIRHHVFQAKILQSDNQRADDARLIPLV
jgi:hypothetical protein